MSNQILVGQNCTFAAMDIQCTDQEQYLIEILADATKKLGYDSYVIGGFVRDKIMGRPTKDLDIVCTGSGIELAHAASSLLDAKPTVNFFSNFGTAQFKYDGIEVEFVGARKESYRADSRKPLVEEGTIEEDQLRRDFTINALAISLNEPDFGRLSDPFDGLQDIADKRIVTPLDPIKTFSDDPLRMMRAIRFACQLGFTIEEKTYAAIISQKQRISIISKERIAEELNKMILSPKPSVGFDLLFKTGLLKLIFPQMQDLAGAENIDGMGHKDNFYHTLQVLDNLAQHSDDLWLRWAAILHDIGKPATKRFEVGHGFTFHGHEVVGGRMVPKIFDQFKLPRNEKMRFVRKMVELHLRPISLTKNDITDAAIRRLLFDAGEDLESLMLLCKADITSKNKNKVMRFIENFEMVQQRCTEVEEKDHIRNWQPPISGELIMTVFDLKPSKPVGEIKEAIRNAILDGDIENNYDAAYTYMLEVAKKHGYSPALDSDK